jgi:cellulose biosynthesis protein BcsQ
MAVYADFNGERIELTGAAEEATMKKILEAIQDQPGSATGAAAGGAAGTAAGMLSMGKNLNLVNVGFKALSAGIGFATGSLKLFSSGIAGAAKLGTSFIAAQPAVTDLTKSLEGLPWIFGDLGSAVHAVTQLLYKNYTTFQQLTTSGIAFGDRLEIMTRFGTRAGVSLDMIAGQLTANSESFAFLGTATRGASMAVEANAQAFAANSSMLQRFGLSFEEQTESFMRFFSLNALGLARETMSRDQLTVMSGNYAKAMRRLSELTGKQADQLQEGVDRANMNRAFQNELAKMPADVRNRFGIILDTVQSGFGDAGREAMMASILGIAPVTDEAANMLSLNRDFGSLLNNLNSSARSFNGNLEMFGNEVNSQMVGFANANRAYADANSGLFSAITMTEGGFAGSQLIYGINLFSGRITEVASNLGVESPLQKAFNSLNSIIQTLRDSLDQTFVSILTDPTFIAGLNSFGDFIREVNADIEAEGFIPYITRKFNQLLDEMFIMMSNSRLMRIAFGISSGDIANTQANRVLNQDDDTVDNRTEAERTADLERLTTGGVPLFGKAAGDPNAPILGAIDIMNKYLSQDYSGRTNFFGSEIGDQQMYQNLSNQLRGKDEEELIEMFGENYEQIIAQMVQELQQYRQTLEDNEQLNVGTFGRYGSVLNDFGRGTLATLHGREAVLNESQLNNLVSGAIAQGANSVMSQNTPNTGAFSDGIGNMANRMVDSNREGNVKLIEALNMLAGKMETQNSLTRQVISTVEQYS